MEISCSQFFLSLDYCVYKKKIRFLHRDFRLMSIYYFLKRRALTIRRKKDSQQRYKLLERRDIVIKRISESLLPSWSKNYPVFGQVGATETSPERRFLLLLSALIETLETTLRLIARYTHAPPKDNRWKKKKEKKEEIFIWGLDKTIRWGARFEKLIDIDRSRFLSSAISN